MISSQHMLQDKLAQGRALKVCFLTVMPSPYTEDVFHAMNADGRIEPIVYYLEQAATGTYWEQSELPDYAEILPGSWFSLFGGRMHVNPGAVGRLRQANADLYVVAGYSGVTNQAVMHWLHASGRPWIFWGETPGMRSGSLLGALRNLAMRPAVRWPDGIAAIGSRAANAYRERAPEHCVVESIPYHCELQTYFDLPRMTENASTTEASQGVRFLYCGQLIERKGVDQLLPAFCRVARHHPRVTLDLVGEGPLRAALESAVPHDLKSRVIFSGFKQIDDLAPSFGAADVFVLPSRHDGWGVVVNQAVAAGMPVICSDAVGAGVDLVEPGKNGTYFPAGDERALEQALAMFADNPALCDTYGRYSRALAYDYTPQCGVDRWWRLCVHVLQASGRISSDFSLERPLSFAK